VIQACRCAFDPPCARLAPGRCGPPVLLALLPALLAGNLIAQTDLHTPIYEGQDRILYAKVKMADGTTLPGFPAVEAICGGVDYSLGFTDAQGNFQFVLDRSMPRFNPSFNSEGETVNFSFLADCEFRADSPGFRSQRVSPRWLIEMKDANTISVGTILLSRPEHMRADSPGDLSLPKSAKDAYRKGGAALAKRKWSEAKSEFEKTVSIQPAYFFGWIGIGLADEALQQWQDASTAYQKAMALTPKSADPYLRMARLGAKTGNWENAAQYSEAALSLDPPNLVEAYSLCAFSNAKLGRMDTAGSCARAGLKFDTANEYPDLWLSLALAQAAAKEYANAAVSLQRYLKLVPQAENVAAIKKELVELRSILAK